MKKLIAIFTVIAMLTVLTPAIIATAVTDFDNLGTIPKVAADSVPVMDAVRDAIYDQGLKIPVRSEKDDNNKLGGGGDMWLLWDADYLYVYATFTFADAGQIKAPHEDYMNSLWWEDTMMEFCVDFKNEGDSNIKFMPSSHGDITAVRGWPAEEPQDVPKVIDGANTVTGNTWNSEFRISWAGSKALLAEKSDDGDGFGGDVAAGKSLGFGVWYHEAVQSGDNASYYACLPARVDDFGVNAPPSYDYITLGANEVTSFVAEPEPEPEPDVPAVGGGDAAPEPPPVPRPVAPATGDGALIFIVLAAIAAVATAKRTIKNKN